MRNRFLTRSGVIGLALVATFWTVELLPSQQIHAGDWPMWRYDAGRTADSPHAIPDRLSPAWTIQLPERRPVWDDPLNQDLMPYDRIFEPIVVGQTLYLGFNDSDKIVAYDTRTGLERWRFYADAPVRLPAAADDGRIYLVSDDGHLYCLDALTGAQLWKFRGGPSERKIIGNERMISTWPARGAPVLRDGTVYFAASIWPFMGTFLYALDAETGDVQWLNDGTGAQYLNQPHNYPAFAGIAPQGALAATSDRLIVPGGRSIPAVFDRATGKFEYFHLAKYGKSGGSSVFATDDAFFGHERDGEFNRFDLTTGDLQLGARGKQPVLSKSHFFTSGKTVSCRSHRDPSRKIWELEVDATGDLIRADNRLYAAGKSSISAIALSEDETQGSLARQLEVDGPVERLLAADDRLFAVTLDGRILAFASADAASGLADSQDKPATTPAPANSVDPQLQTLATSILDSCSSRVGYALVYGAGNGELLEALAQDSELRILAIDSDVQTVERLRRRFDSKGLYGQRISLQVSDLEQFMAPPYFASLIVMQDPQAVGFENEPRALKRLYRSLRPYGGIAWLPNTASPHEAYVAGVDTAKLERAEIRSTTDWTLLSREGALEGAGDWTHQYGDIANTVKSDDSLVKLPLGLLWFGGSSNMDVLPRHGHGPPEQVVGGRLFIQGVKSLSARDVYTGTVLWKVELEAIDNFGVYFDETYEDTPLSTKYNQVHIPGANARGTNFVATLERVYIIEGKTIRVLASDSGETLKKIALPPTTNGRQPDEWGYIGVYKDFLIAGVGFANYSSKLKLPHDLSNNRKSRWRFTDYDHTASDALMVMNRFTGEPVWKIDAVHSFLHNGIAVADDTLFVLDKVPENIEQRLARRGQAKPETYRLLALSTQDGQTRWETSENVFGTWLSCSTEHGILLQSTRPSNDTVRGEDGRHMIAYRADNGKILWDRAVSYKTPPILHGERIITGGHMYELLTGDPILRTDPITGQVQPWSFTATKGCNYPIACENLLTFRSSSAAFYDLVTDGGTGHFGGFKSGCTSNLVAAGGVLNAPDYTRTCSCSFQNQTSLALIHMPELEIWTHNDFGYSGQQVQQVGINFGAPGDRRSDDGTLWLDWPSVGGPSPNIAVDVAGQADYFRHHSLRFAGEDAWISASGLEGNADITLRLAPRPPKQNSITVSVQDGTDDVEEDKDGNIDAGSSDLELTFDDGPQTIGIRFASVPLPTGSRLRSAYLQFQVDETSSEPTSLAIAAETSANARPFAKKRFDVSSRKRTTERALWKPARWNKVDAAGKDQRSPDIKALVEEIISRPDWKPGNAMAFILTGTGERTAEAFDGDKRAAAKLVLELDEASLPTPVATKKTLESQLYTVRLYFAERDPTVEPGDRIFDVRLQDQTMLSQFDIVAEAEGPQRQIVKEFTGLELSDTLTISLTGETTKQPSLGGVEIIAE